VGKRTADGTCPGNDVQRAPATLLTHEIVISHLRLTDADIGFMRLADGRANWRSREDKEPGRRNVRVSTLAVADARVTYRDALYRVEADVRGYTRNDGPYETRIQFTGEWRDGGFEGVADTGSVLSLRGSAGRFCFRAVLKRGQDHFEADSNPGSDYLRGARQNACERA
jgi:hypothetical protein